MVNFDSHDSVRILVLHRIRAAHMQPIKTNEL
jgi:hypothetical protein